MNKQILNVTHNIRFVIVFYNLETISLTIRSEPLDVEEQQISYIVFLITT